ncbi:SUMF1/EgtB/PvdO family nonheme iron enzyme [Lignipirellula cremea]|uniref:Formylglycine-generating sulfatase enzyme n=1 Tax=Lignipirellula cremea TaxID=2528010 RepID=A0A518DL11_9BACT|nr:SUMF1/EgtB/PvdO family nonheme iron enzyme [Lignipirellula cremea]QDU92520.1 Formylglycine-generating sulfatase enzyme [Lignipirellula cremea]
MKWKTSALLFLLLSLAGGARAEYRVALLIDNQQANDADEATAGPSLQALAQRLEKRGFVCQIAGNLDNENAIRDAIEGFASRTPTCSTALLVYRGQVAEGSSLQATDSRGKYSLDRVFQAFRDKGGCRQSLIFIDAGDAPDFDGELPAACQLTSGDTAVLLQNLDREADLVAALAEAGKTISRLPAPGTLTGQASTAISPPDRFRPGVRPGDEWVNDMGLVFCWCPPGEYQAGSPPGTPDRYADEEPRKVVLQEGFWISKYELARSQEVAQRRPGANALARLKLDPMTMINHDDAQTMLRNLTANERQADRLPADWQYALPTEEQWEYAARAGTTGRFYFGEELRQLPQHANFADKTYYDSNDIFSNAAHRTLDDGALKLAPVGSYQANPWGLHDMYGNVAEWCVNGAIRGGSWTSVPENCRSAYRDFYSSRNEQNFIGYRLVIQKKQPDEQNARK